MILNANLCQGTRPRRHPQCQSKEKSSVIASPNSRIKLNFANNSMKIIKFFLNPTITSPSHHLRPIPSPPTRPRCGHTTQRRYPGSRNFGSEHIVRSLGSRFIQWLCVLWCLIRIWRCPGNASGHCRKESLKNNRKGQAVLIVVLGHNTALEWH